MKHIYSLFLIVFCSFTTFGQEYHRLLNESTYWDGTGAEMGYFCTGFSNAPPKRNFFKEDTIFNGKTYARAFEQIMITDYPPLNCPPFYVDTNAYIKPFYFLREDTIEKKVWRYNSYNDTEMLLYDFSLEKGDTLYHSYTNPTIIDTVYSIITSDGVERLKFDIGRPGGGYGDGYYIEGIGGVAGLFAEPIYYFESGSWLMCVKDLNNNIILDINGHCYDFITNTTEVSLKNTVNIFPNPFSEYILIELRETNSKAYIYNQLGQIIVVQNLANQNNIDLSKLNSGIYLVKILTNENEVYTKKIIKK